MNVQLKCGCGSAQEVSITQAGQTVMCAGCGQRLTVPALGVAVAPAKCPPPRPRPEPSPFADLRGPAAAEPTESRPVPRRRNTVHGVAGLLLIAGGTLLLAAGTLGLWWLSTPAPSPTVEVRGEVVARGEPAKSEPAKEDSVKGQAPTAPRSGPPVAPPVEEASEPPLNRPLPEASPEKPPLNKPVARASGDAVKPHRPAKRADEEKPAVPVVKAPLKRFKADDTFLQDLQVTQTSRFLVSGIPVGTLLKYRVVSRYTVQKVDADGELTVRQEIESAALLQADDLTQGILSPAIARLPGTAFTLTVNARGEVTEFTGARAALMFGQGRVPGGLGVQMASLLDADGWKELGQAVFYKPEEAAKPGRWTRGITHNWGPLGAWAGEVTYAYPGPDPKAATVKVPYALKLGYRPPKGPGVPGALPFQVAASEFKAAQAEGALLFETHAGRTAALEERFHVRGALVLVLLGQRMPAEVEEEQLFQMRIIAK
jgi:hypothetical protein